MSAARLLIDTDEDGAWLADAATTAVRQIVPPQSRIRCPECHSIVYSRRNPLCGVCGSELPPEALFSAVEAARVETLMKLEGRRHREWLEEKD